MKPHRQFKLQSILYIVLGALCSAACGSSVYPASECKSPPPPLTVPESPRSQCREVSTEHANEWPQKYKDIQYSEENAVYWMRAAFIELEPATQKELKAEFARALSEINSADGKYLQLVDATVGAKGGDYAEATKMLSETLGTFMKFFDEHLKPASLTSGAQKNIQKAKAAYQQLKNHIEPPAPASTEEEPSAPSNEKEQEEEPQSEMMKTD
jgi:hypothetical protein